jgi:hypothetical protein
MRTQYLCGRNTDAEAQYLCRRNTYDEAMPVTRGNIYDDAIPMRPTKIPMPTRNNYAATIVLACFGIDHDKRSEFLFWLVASFLARSILLLT